MAFENLSDKLQNVFKNLKSKGRLTEEDVHIACKDVKMALLEADVNFRVVKKFIKTVACCLIVILFAIPVFIGSDSDPISIDGGIKNQLSDKGVIIELKNLDKSYNFIKVYLKVYYSIFI